MTTIPPPSSTVSSDPGREDCPYLYGTVWQSSYLTKDAFRSLVAAAGISLIAVLPTIVLNALVIAAVATRRRLRTNSNILLACLAGIDLLTGMVVQPMGIAVKMKQILGVGPFCTVEKLFRVALALVGSASFNHVVLISVDRYIAIKHSLRYHEIVTNQRIITSILLAWTITVVMTIQEIALAVIDSQTQIFLAYATVRDVVLTIISLVYIAVITYTYRYIFSETRRQNRQIQTDRHLTHEETKITKKDKKAANTVAIILAAVGLTYLPFIICFSFISATNSFGWNTIKPALMSLRWTTTIMMLGSLVNPVIYCWRNKKFRRVFQEILHLK